MQDLRGLIMKSSSRTQLFITLLLLFLITSPCRLAASSLESKLQTLSTSLTGLKGKLGKLKSKLRELQGNLAGVLIPPTFDDDEASTVVTMSWTQIDPKVGGALKIQNHNDFLNHIVNPNQENSTTDIILDMDKLQDKQFKKNTYFSENDKFKALQKLLQSKKYYPHLKKIWIYKKKDFGFFGYMADSFGNTKAYNYQHTDWEINYPFASPPTIPASPIPPSSSAATPPASAPAPAPSHSSSSSSSSWQSLLINKKVRLVLVAGDITQQHFQDSEKAAIVNGASSTFIFGGGVSAKISEALDSKARDIGNYLKELTWHQSGSLKSNIFITNGITSSNKNYGQMAIAFPPEQVKNFIENGRHRWNYNAGDPKSGGCIGSALIHEAYTEEKQPLPFKYLVQAIGPNMTEVSGLTITKLITPTSYHQNQLKFAYQNGLLCADQFQLKSIAFPVVSGGVFRYPTKEAIEVAVKSCVDYLEENAATTNIKEIRFVVWSGEKDKRDSSGNTIDGAIFRLNTFDHHIKNNKINNKNGIQITPLDQQYYETNNLTQAPDGTLRGFIKVYEFDLGANQLPSSSSSAAPSASIDTTLLEQLASDLKYYKTNNADHSGHLYEHSIWTAMVIDRWFEEKNGTATDSDQSASSWLEGISESDRNTLVLAGFLHDVGKASNLNSNYNFVNASASLNTSTLNCAQYPTYNIIGSHPQDGFNFLRLIAPYNLSIIKNSAGLYNAHFKKNGQLNFAQMFQELGLTEEQQQIIQILTGIHWSFGADLMIHNNPQNFLLTLKKYVGETDYNNKKIDDRILRLAIAIGAADVCGMQSEPDAYFNEFKQRSPYFQSPVFEQPKQYHATKSPKQQFNDWGYRARGITQRNSLLAFFTKNPQLALIAPVEVPHFFQTPFLYASTLFTQYHETLNPGCC